MIYEVRTYRIMPGSLAELEKRFAQAYEHRKKHSKLTAFLRTEIGPLNEITHIWGYEDLAERARIRAEASKDGTWPPKIQEFIHAQRVETVHALKFIPAAGPGKVGPFFEIRRDVFRPGTLPKITGEWQEALAQQANAARIVLAGGIEFGQHNAFLHIWAHDSLGDRIQFRNGAGPAAAWSPPGAADQFLEQETKIATPSVFSPLQ